MGAIMREVWIRQTGTMFRPGNYPTLYVTTFRMV